MENFELFIIVSGGPGCSVSGFGPRVKVVSNKITTKATMANY